MSAKLPPHPMQPLIKTPDDDVRFRPNPIVRFLLEFSKTKGVGLNELAMMPFDDSDREQLAQLIGYSLCGYGELSYVSSESYARALKKSEKMTE